MTLDQVRHSLRTLSRHKRFATLAILSLGIAIALNTTMYSVLDTMINPRLAMRAPESLFFLTYYGDRRRLIPWSERNAAVRDGLTFHAGVAGAEPAGSALPIQHGSVIREGRVLTVTPDYLTLLDVRAMAGRLIAEHDVGAETSPVVVSERLWRQLFPDSDRFQPASVFVQGKASAIVGVLPLEADLPGANTDVWQLPAPEQMADFPLNLVRLRPNVTLAQAERELGVLDLRYKQRTREDHGSGYRLRSATAKPFRPWQFHWALIGAVFTVLLIACANLANLQLARGVSRTRELATRSAVGATRGDIVAQLVLKSAWLALGGLLVGGLLTMWGVHLVDSFVPPSIADYVSSPQASWRVFVFAVGATLFCLALVGLAPAIRLSRVDIGQLLKSGTGTGTSRSARRQYGVLVVTEVALALALLSSSALLIRSALVLRSFEPANAQRMTVHSFVRVSRASPTDMTSRRQWSDRVIRHALAVDSVVSAATVRYEAPANRTVTVYDGAGAFVRLGMYGGFPVVSPDFFRAAGIPIVKGRDFSSGEFAEPLVIVDVVAARSLWPGMDAVGQQLKLGPPESRLPWLRVVGVSGDPDDRFRPDQDYVAWRHAVRGGSARSNRFEGQIFVLNAADTVAISNKEYRNGFRGEVIVLQVRTAGDPHTLPLKLNTALSRVAPNLRSSYPRTWDQNSGMERRRAQHDFIAALFGVFALFALALAALGVYAIVAHMVAQRTREFGVRIAVGAGERDIRELVLREGNILSLTGIAIGLMITYWTAAFVRAFVFSDYDRYDSRVFAVVVVVLFAVSWLASYIPARRAIRINPVEALRND